MAKMTGGFRLPSEPDITQGVIQRVSAAEGGFGYRVCTTRSGIGALGIYFVQGAVGVFFYPMQRDDGFIYRQVSQEQFETAVHRQFGLVLRW